MLLVFLCILLVNHNIHKDNNLKYQKKKKRGGSQKVIALGLIWPFLGRKLPVCGDLSYTKSRTRFKLFLYHANGNGYYFNIRK